MDIASLRTDFTASKDYVAQANLVIAGGVNSNVRLSNFPVPLCFERGEGAYLYDFDGNRFIDYALGMGPTILGHAPQPLCDAVAKSLSLGQVLGGQHRSELDLAKRLRVLVPSAELVRIGMTGSEVVQAALRVSRAFTGRRKFIKFEGQYHGWFDNVLISHRPPSSASPNDTVLVRSPHLETAGQSESVIGDIIVLPWNDVAAVEQTLAEHGSDIAAIITEPVMCNTGVIPPAPGYLEALRSMSSAHRVVLIFDEVITGFRLAIGGAQQRFGVTPDLSTFAKAMAGGFPISALVGRADIMSLFGSGKVNHSGTYNAGLPSVAASIATLDILAANEGAILRDLEARGDNLIEGLRGTAIDMKSDLRVQGFGSCFNVFFSDNPTLRSYEDYQRTDLTRQAQFLKHLISAGVRPTTRSTWFVSTAHSDDDIAETLDAARWALENMIR